MKKPLPDFFIKRKQLVEFFCFISIAIKLQLHLSKGSFALPPAGRTILLKDSNAPPEAGRLNLSKSFFYDGGPA